MGYKHSDSDLAFEQLINRQNQQEAERLEAARRIDEAIGKIEEIEHKEEAAPQAARAASEGTPKADTAGQQAQSSDVSAGVSAGVSASVPAKEQIISVLKKILELLGKGLAALFRLLGKGLSAFFRWYGRLWKRANFWGKLGLIYLAICILDILMTLIVVACNSCANNTAVSSANMLDVSSLFGG